MRRPLAPVEMIEIVARGLGDLRSEVAFLGGAILGMLVTDSAAREARPTEDVDVIVEVATTIEYSVLETKLRGLGFSNVMAGPICRYRYGDVLLDVMPTIGEILGFGNRWYPIALKEAEETALSDGLSCRVISAPCFLATKFEAFNSPSRENYSDYFASRDFEDIVTVIDGRPEIAREVAIAQDAVLAFVKDQAAFHLQQTNVADAISAHLDIDSASQARVSTVLARLRDIATI